MTPKELREEFESMGYTSWINSDIYPDGKIYTQEYTEWLERKVEKLSKSLKNSLICNENTIIHHGERVYTLDFGYIQAFGTLKYDAEAFYPWYIEYDDGQEYAVLEPFTVFKAEP